jgi:N-methylhydantoinase A
MEDLLAVDVGGTFTDLVVLDSDTGDTRFAKTLTTVQPEEGVLEVVSRGSGALESSQVFFHGTTLGINSVLQGKGALTGLITTRGFRDVLEIARMLWPPYQLHWDKPAPIVPRYLRTEATERVSAQGEVLLPLDERDVRAAGAYLVEQGVEAVAVCFLHAYRFPDHELRVREILAEVAPEVAVTLSHEVSREYLEYERTVTTAIDASIRPLISTYVDSLQRGLRQEGFGGSLLLTRSDGGVMSADEAKRHCVRTLVSGPASGVMGAAELGRWLGLPNLIAADMGGTSFDAALVRDHEPVLVSRTAVEHMPLLLPVVELVTIGAGGGSIAWIDQGGALNVGPESAGATPGPIAFGRGGTRPTFTDAALVTGMLDHQNFLGGEVTLDLEAAREGVQREIAEPLGLETSEAAGGIVDLTEAKMASLLEELTIARGQDPRDFALLAYGGGGPLVASSLAQRLSIATVVIPPSPATFSAWGMLSLDIVHDFAQTVVTPLELVEPAEIRAQFERLERAARDALDREGVEPERQRVLQSIDMRYEGQEHTLTIPLRAEDDLDVGHLRTLFDEAHHRAYGYAMADPAEVTAYRVRAVGGMERPKRPELAGADDLSAARKGSREVVHRASGGRLSWEVYDRGRLGPGVEIAGPAIVEEASSTVLVPPGRVARVHVHGSLVITDA